MKNRINILFIISAFIFLLASCSKESIHGDGFNHATSPERTSAAREDVPEKRHVLLLYSAGFNSISDYLKEDIQDLMAGWFPGPGRNDNIILVYSHQPRVRGDYSTPTSPSLTRIWTDHEGNVIADTLVRYPSDVHSATPGQLHDVLDFVNTTFPAKSYGMIFSSHATGYLPGGYYTHPLKYVFNEKQNISYRYGGNRRNISPVPYVEPEHDPSLPAVKSVGQDQVGSYGQYVSYEIELDDFAKAIPMQMEYILFDACLMGGIEVAYELKDICHYVAFSQTEVLAEGFDYKLLTQHLLKSDTPNPQAVCEDFYNQYIIQSGVYQSATISMVDCTRLTPLANTCQTLFEKYRGEINRLQKDDVQRYYRDKYNWFFDLYDIVAKAGANEEELNELQNGLDQCVIYKNATPGFMGVFNIDSHSGFSMYLPGWGSNELDKYYSTLKWNKATSLVK